MKKFLIYAVPVIFVHMLFVSCATDYKRWPEGGPSDKVSPTVGYVSIPDGSLNVDNNAEIRIRFSEFIDRNTARSAVSISPRSAMKKSKVLWYDKSAGIKFKGLDSNQTVIISINPSLKDMQGNPLADAFSLSFSTGSTIDRKIINGKIIGAIDRVDPVKPNFSRVKINIYKITNDSINYSSEEPEYTAGLASNYNFELRNLSSGIYKLVAYDDVNNNSKPDLESEMIAFSPDLCDLDSGDSLRYELVLGYNDTDPPFIKNTTISENDVIRIDFSEPIRFNPGAVEKVEINGDVEEFMVHQDKYDEKTIWLSTKKLSVKDLVTVFLGSLSDGFGNVINEKLRVKAHTVSDTAVFKPFRILSKLPSKIPADGQLELRTTSFFNDSLSLSLTSVSDSTEYELKETVLKTPYVYTAFLSGTGLVPAVYELSISYSDSVLVKQKMEITEETGFGSISGKIEGGPDTGFVLTFRPVTDGEKTAVQAVSGAYKVEVRPGRYICAAFEDKEGKAVFGHDIYKGKTASAVFYEDSILVRKNWESAEVDFLFESKKKGR